MTEEGISHEDYEHAQLLWTTFNIQDVGQYSDIYLECDVLLLCEVTEDFCDMCSKSYKIDYDIMNH